MPAHFAAPGFHTTASVKPADRLISVRVSVDQPQFCRRVEVDAVHLAGEAHLRLDLLRFHPTGRRIAIAHAGQILDIGDGEIFHGQVGVQRGREAERRSARVRTTASMTISSFPPTVTVSSV